MSLSERRARLDGARLYFICGATPGGRPLADVLPAALRGGVDVFQLRMKDAGDEEILAAAAVAREACAAAGALFILNDRPDLVAAAGADGAHVGQDDMPVQRARELAGADRLVGLSTHTPEQIDAAADADYIGVGPVHVTPTKPGRPAVGVELVEHAVEHAPGPWFAIGGVAPDTLPAVLAAGARRVAVVRAIAEADDPEAAARGVHDVLEAADAYDRRHRRPSSEERNAALRAALRPLAPGERPAALVVAVVVAVLLGLANVVLFAAGGDAAGGGSVATLAVYCALMLGAAWGMWHKRYVAVLLFQTLLAVITIIFFLFLLRASTVGDVLLALAIVVPAGWLFWKLVRVLARMKAPVEQPSDDA